MRETMRDRGRFWTPAPDPDAVLERDGFCARRVCGLGQTLVSGDLAAAVAALAPGAPQVGLWQVAESGVFGVRIARDRCLLVTPAPPGVEPGWRDGFAATPCDDAFAVIEISGEALDPLVAEAVAADLSSGSGSAAVPFAGVAALLYRLDARTARLHVESPLAAYLWAWLDGRR